jgi:hypothetical protein
MTTGAWVAAAFVAAIVAALVIPALRAGPGGDWRRNRIAMAVLLALLGGGLVAGIDTNQSFTTDCHGKGGTVTGGQQLSCIRNGRIIEHT